MPYINGFRTGAAGQPKDIILNKDDERITRYNGFAASSSGTTTCTITIPSAQSDIQTGRLSALSLDWLYAVATGTGAMEAIVTAGSSEVCRFRLITNVPIDMQFQNAPILTERGESLTVTISGGTATACALTIGGRRIR
jgi:hypothetical protein